MKKVIRLTETDLTKIIKRVIEEQQENSEKCQKFAAKRKSYKAKGERIIRFAPKKVQNMLTSIFNTGLEKGPEAFKNSVPQNIKAEFQKKIATLKKPKSDMEVESMISDVENEVKNIQEQFYGPAWLMPAVMILSVLLVLVVLIWGREEAPLCSSYRG
jgi:HD superfamily phosphohydrolase